MPWALEIKAIKNNETMVLSFKFGKGLVGLVSTLNKLFTKHHSTLLQMNDIYLGLIKCFKCALSEVTNN
jgi:hypothetical protein